MRLRKLQSGGDYLWGTSYLGMYFDAVSSGEDSTLAGVVDWLKSKYLHYVEKTVYDTLDGQISHLTVAFADYDFKDADKFWKSGASLDKNSCQQFGDYLRTHFPRKAKINFSRSTNFQSIPQESNFPVERPEVPSFEAGVMQISFTKSPDVIQQFPMFITTYETPRHQEVLSEILRGQRARYDKSALREYLELKKLDGTS